MDQHIYHFIVLCSPPLHALVVILYSTTISKKGYIYSYVKWIKDNHVLPNEELNSQTNDDSVKSFCPFTYYKKIKEVWMLSSIENVKRIMEKEPR